MGYYKDRKIMVIRIKTWCYAKETERDPWSKLVAEAGENFGFSSLSLKNILTQVSQGKLFIDENGQLQKKNEE